MSHHLIRSLLFKFDAEFSHDLTLKALSLSNKIGLLSFLKPPNPCKLRTVMGIPFQNPVGLAAGLDKNANYIDAFIEYQDQFIRSFVYAIAATILALAISYPLAYAIAFRAGKYKNILLILVIAPFFTSFLLRTIAWKQILGAEGPVVYLLRTLHLIGPDTTITASSFAVVMGLTYNFLPFMTLPIYASLDRIDPRLMEASGDLYASGITTFRKVTVPLSMPGVVAGTLLTFIPAAGDYINAAILGNPTTKMIGNVIDSRFFRIVDYPTAAALSFTLMAAILFLVVIYIRRSGTDELV